MKKILLILTLLVVGYSLALAQENKVGGRVTGSDGTGLPGITIQVKGTNAGTATDAQGQFRVNVPENSTLIFHGIGYQDQTIEVGSRSVINVTLKPTVRSLDEFVVVGYGTKRQIGTIVGSVATVSDKVIQYKPSPNVLDALQGEVPGVQIFTSSGEPSAEPSIRIHGVGSLGASSTPLILLDGIPISSGTLLSLNPNDIAGITVLKDASSTSIYGSRAANGVLYITTKEGISGKGRFTLTGQYGISNLANTKFFEQFMHSDQLLKLWLDEGAYTQAQADAIKKKYPYDTRWYKYYYNKNVPMKQIDGSFSGGSESTKYFLSGSYLNQEGLAFRSGYQRYTLRANLTSRVNEWLKFGANFGLGYDERETNPYGSNSTNRGLFFLAQPWYPALDSNGHRFKGVIPGWGRYDPQYLAENVRSNANNLQINPTGYVEINPVRGLTLRSQGGIDWYDYRESGLRLPSYLGSLNNGNASEEFDRAYTTTITNTAEYSFNLNADNAFTLLAGQEYISYNYQEFDGSSSGQSDDRLVLLDAGPNDKQVSSGISQYAYASYFGRIDYNYKSRYFFNASIRNDASSRFGKNNRNAMFWSAGALWKIKQDFFQHTNWLNNLDFRVSYGTSGNSAIDNYKSLATVSSNQYDGKNSFQLSTPGNANLQWETQKQANIGIDVDIFDRGHFDIEYYHRVTDNMLVDVPYPYTSGFSSVTSNVGSLLNAGFDVSIKYDVARGKDFYVTPYINFNYNKNKVTKLFQDKKLWVIPNTGVCWVVGQPVMFFMPLWAGVDTETGAPTWYKPNPNPDDIGHMRKDPQDLAVGDGNFSADALQQNTGFVRYPPFSGGFGLNAGYKGFYVRADFSFYNKKYLFDNDAYFYANPFVFFGFNTTQDLIGNVWEKKGDHAKYPSFDYQTTQFDSRAIENASFSRLKILEVGYDFSKSLLRKAKILNGARVFFTGRNLLTFTKYQGPDPEVDSNLALGTNPNTKQYVFGLQIQF